MSEAQAMQDREYSDLGAEFDAEEREQAVEDDRSRMLALYKDAQRAQVGATIRCPTCQRLHVKTTYHKAFCSNGRTKGKGKKNCKDGYWNFVDRERCERASSFK